MPNTPLLTPALLVDQHGRTIPLTERVLGHHLTLCMEDQQRVYSARDEQPQALRTLRLGPNSRGHANTPSSAKLWC
jgi:hypothetical protein